MCFLMSGFLKEEEEFANLLTLDTSHHHQLRTTIFIILVFQFSYTMDPRTDGRTDGRTDARMQVI